MKLYQIPLFGFVVCTGFTHLNAQTTVSTDPVGFVSVDIRGRVGTTNANSFISLPMTRPTAYQGVAGTPSLNGSSNTVLTFSSANFTSNQFNGTSNRHYAQLTSGPNAGFVTEVLATTANTLTLRDNLTNVITANSTTLKIIPYWTLGTALPAGGGLNGGPNANIADNVSIFNNGVPTTYFYNTTANQWRQGGANANDAVIPPGNGLQILRRASNNVTLVVTGSVPLGPTAATVAGGTATQSRNSLSANPYPLASVTLANSGLSNTITGGPNANVADTVTIYGTNGVPSTYFYNTTVSQWRQGGANANTVVIPSGSAVVINRKANRALVDWYIPQPTMNLQ